MITVYEDFRTRSGEVNDYFDFVVGLAYNDVILLAATGKNLPTNLTSNEFIKTLKASCYLLLYNLVESTMRNAIEAIFDRLKETGTTYDLCRLELKTEILKNFRRRKTDSLLTKINTIAFDVIHETFISNEIFSGNLDAKSIKETASRYGFSAPSGSQSNLLLTVKNIRNDLAHGVKSFAEVGRDATPNDLQDAKEQTFNILNQTLQNIEDYLTRRSYLMSSSPAN